MKNVVLLLVSMLTLIVNSQAATVYNVTGNSNWTSLVGGNCSACTFNISSGITLTLNTGNSCANCIFNGGTLLATANFTVQQSAFNNINITLNGNTLTLQGGGVDNSFSGAAVTASGSGGVIQTSKTTIAGSSFTLSSLAQYFVNGGQLDITASRFYLNDNSSLFANSGPVNLNSNSNITAGDGTTSSKAYIYLNGPQLTLVDANSTFAVANFNNYYFNWSTYKSTTNGLSFSTGAGGNCGVPGKNSCSAPKYFGCAIFSKTGASTCTVLSAMIVDFSAALVSGNKVRLSWSLQTPDDGTIVIERSTDAVTFEVIGSRAARSSGNAGFTDPAPSSGLNYYRITLTGFDGVKINSGILTVRAGSSALSPAIQIFPNPVTSGRFTIRTASAQPAVLSVFSQEGRLITGATLTGQTEYTVSLPGSATAGLLVVRVISGKQTTTFSLLNKP